MSSRGITMKLEDATWGAWIECPEAELPQNLAWGRDYNDVCPIHGVLLGGARHTLHVGVDVVPVA